MKGKRSTGVLSAEVGPDRSGGGLLSRSSSLAASIPWPRLRSSHVGGIRGLVPPGSSTCSGDVQRGWNSANTAVFGSLFRVLDLRDSSCGRLLYRTRGTTTMRRSVPVTGSTGIAIAIRIPVPSRSELLLSGGLDRNQPRQFTTRSASRHRTRPRVVFRWRGVTSHRLIHSPHVPVHHSPSVLSPDWTSRA